MKPKPIITLSFDDCYQRTLNNTLPVLVKYQMKGTYNFIAGLAGKKFEGFKLASWGEIKKAEKIGMEIGSHSLTHDQLITKRNLAKYLKSFLYKQDLIKHVVFSLQNTRPLNRLSTIKTATGEIARSQQYFQKHGIKVDSFVYPYGLYDNEIKEIVKNYYSSARGTDWGLNNINSYDAYALKIFIWDKWTRIETANKWVENAIKEKAWLIEVFHLIAEDNGANYEYFTTISDFQTHLEFIKNRKIWVASQKEVIKYLNNEKR